MSRMRAFLGSMAGRIFLILFAGVLASGTVGVLAADYKRRLDLDRLHLERTADRLQDFVGVLNAATPDIQGALERRGGPGVRMPRADAWTISSGDPDLARVLRQRLQGATVEAVGRGALSQCFGDLVEERGLPGLDGESALRPPDCWLVRLRLADGRPLTVELLAPPRFISSSRAFDPFYLAVLALAAGLLSWIVARIAARPLAALASAAQDLGADLGRPPLPVEGPTEVRSAAAAFNAMQMRLRESLLERTRLLAAITHDLQTPLTRLRLRVEALPECPPKEGLLSDWTDMRQLIREGLDLAQGAETGEPPARIDLGSLLESLVADEADAGRDVRLVRDCGCDVLARPRAIVRCVGNLLSNALAYGGRVEVWSRAQSHHVEIGVRDFGPGIPEAQLERVFDPFVRLDPSRSRETGGTGLGLTIARTLVEKDGGRLTLHNHPGGGLEAILTLPRIV